MRKETRVSYNESHGYSYAKECICSWQYELAYSADSTAPSDDWSPKEAIVAILRITRGNIRLIERLMLQCVSCEPASGRDERSVETARQNLIIGPD